MTKSIIASIALSILLVGCFHDSDREAVLYSPDQVPDDGYYFVTFDNGFETIMVKREGELRVFTVLLESMRKHGFEHRIVKMVAYGELEDRLKQDGKPYIFIIRNET